MSQEREPEPEMRPEYDLRGGVRGKYLERYRRWTIAAVEITLTSPYVVQQTNSAAPESRSITKTMPPPPPQRSPQIQVGTSPP